MSNQHSEDGMDLDSASVSSSEQDFEIHDGQDDSGDEYVDPSLDYTLEKEYQEAQRSGAAEFVKGSSDAFKRTIASDRPKRRAAKQTINYGGADQDWFKSPSEELTDPDPASGDLASEEKDTRSRRVESAKPIDLATVARWEARAIEEARPHSWADPFIPTWDDIQRWVHSGPPPPFDAVGYEREQRKRQKSNFTLPPPAVTTMRAHSSYGGSPAANGYSNNIVQEYLAPNDLFVEDFQAFKTLNENQKQDVIQREAEEYGMEKPRGYNVSFHYNPHVEYHHFGSSHPMKPWRLTLTKQLIMAYGLEYTMDLYEPRPATYDEISIFHDREYTQFLEQITPQNMKQHENALMSFGFAGESNDCPVFEGLWNYVCLYSGASMHAAQNLLNGQSDIAINWSGGLHHARKGGASGFCYVNDIVLAIQHLLTQNQRVLYIDIDVHHGDGVESAFESTDRVFTLSYHKFGNDRNGYPFFPGTGNIDEMGPTDPTNRGKGHALNIPIDDGIDDDQYKWLFKTVTGAVVDKYQPNAIVLQSGADSLGGDRLGRFNLNIKAHGFCVETVKSYNRPLLLIGGGGYTPRNVARTWCHETAVCVGANLHNELPTHIPYIQAFQGEENGGGIMYPDLHNTKRHDNMNSDSKLQDIVQHALENLRYLEGAPSVVVNTRGTTEEQLMRIREEIDRELEEEMQDKMYLSVEQKRKTREKNVGGRGERALR